MHEPKLTPGRAGGAVAQNMPIRASWDTVILPPQKIPRLFTASNPATGIGIPANHALCMISNGNVTLTLTNLGDQSIVLPFPATAGKRIIPIVEIGNVGVTLIEGASVALWIEDLRAMEPWICEGAYRP